MRKLFILIAILLLPLMVTKAQDNGVAPIIVQFENKLYAVSSEYGTSRVLVELAAGYYFTYSGYQLSPDGTKLVYAAKIDATDANNENLSLFILDLVDGTSTELQASGGVFDRQVANNHTFTLGYYTWTVDGTRVYYTRIELDGENSLVEVQIVYYDLATQQYHLVARTDPKRSVPNLVGIDRGVMASWGNDQSWTLYAPDNHVEDVKALDKLYGHMLRYEGQDYYALDDGSGKFSTIVNPVSGEHQELGKGYHSAVRIRSLGDASLIAVQTPTEVTLYRKTEANKAETVTVIPAGQTGIRVALSPDGQSLAYLQFNEFNHALLRVLTPTGYTYELPILADAIFWGASETVVFHTPAQ